MTTKRFEKELSKFSVQVVGIEIKKFMQWDNSYIQRPYVAWKGVFRHAGVSYALGEQVAVSGKIPMKEVRGHLMEQALISVPKSILCGIDRDYKRLRQ